MNNKITRKLLLPLAVLRHLTHTGAHELEPEQANPVIVINTLSFASALLAGTFALVIFLCSGDYGILIAGLAEALFFSLFIVFNHFGRYRISATCYIILHQAALFYFAVLRGMVAEERLLLVFLLICSLLVFSRPLDMGLSIGAGAVVLAFGRINEYIRFIPVTTMDQRAVSPFHDLGTIALFLLIAVALLLFKRQDVLLIRRLRMSNQNLESKVQQRTRQLERANENIRFFYDQLSHDMRDKLHGLDQMNQLLLKYNGKVRDREVDFYGKCQHEAIDSLMDMVSDILTVKMIEAGQYQKVIEETIDLSQRLSGLVGVARFTAESMEKEIHLTLADDLPRYIITDPVKLDKILSNLLSNATRHTSRFVAVRVMSSNNRLLIQIKDNGAGIPAGLLPRLFDKDYTSDANSGTGLGLYIVRWLCDLLQIKLEVASSQGRGTTFSLSIPFKEGSEKSYRAGLPVPASLNLSGHTILIADDAFANRFVLAKNLQAEGCTVLEAENGAQALHLAAAKRPDLIILDNQMPVMSGLQALDQLRGDERIAHIPVILMTASTPKGMGDLLLEADADDYITKPVGMDQVKRSIARLLERREISEEREL